jgi:phage tail sheath gpL-like
MTGSTAALLGETLATVGYYGQEDAAAPFQFKPLNTLPPKEGEDFDLEDKNVLLNAGYATVMRSTTGKLLIQYLRTNYTQTDAGVDDISYREVNTVLINLKLGYDTVQLFNSYPDYKLAADGASYPSHIKVMTPSLAKGLMIAQFQKWLDKGLVEDMDAFKESLTITKEGNGLKIWMSPNHINRFRQADVVNLYSL